MSLSSNSRKFRDALHVLLHYEKDKNIMINTLYEFNPEWFTYTIYEIHNTAGAFVQPNGMTLKFVVSGSSLGIDVGLAALICIMPFHLHRHDKQLSLVVDYFRSLLLLRISSTSFLPSVLLLTIDVAIIGVAVVVVAAGAAVNIPSMLREVPPIKLRGQYLFVKSLFNSVQGDLDWLLYSHSWADAIHQDKASSVKVPVANVTLFSSAHLLRENTNSVHSNQRIRPTAPSVPFRSLKLTANKLFVVSRFHSQDSVGPVFLSD
ncbi:hypothetical protein Tco_0596370 [Tanacetum coccineum]